jgi:hypothetical protein
MYQTGLDRHAACVTRSVKAAAASGTCSSAKTDASITLVHLCDRIRIERIHRGISSDQTGEREFCLVDVKPDDVETHCLRVLNGNMPETTEPRDRDPLAGRVFVSLIPLYVVTPARWKNPL